MEMFDIIREEVGPVFVGIIVFFIVFYLLALIYSVVAYILGSLGIHVIAKRRGILHPWLAWLPFGCPWILGSISDQYQQTAKGKIRRRSMLLLVLSIVSVVAYAAIYVVMIYEMAASSSPADTFILTFLVSMLALVALIIVCAVFTYLALYDLYASCNPRHAVTFLLLSIFLPAIMPIFIFANRKKDLGMVCVAQEALMENNMYVAEAPEESDASE